MKRTLLVAAALFSFSPLMISVTAAEPAPSASPCCGTCPTEGMTCPAFAQKIALVDLLEIDLGEVAQTNASLASVKKFGAYMIKSHSEINQWLTKVAAETSITIPTKLDAESAATLKKLSGLEGEAFDKTYIPAMVAGRTQVLAMIKSFAGTCPNPTLEKFAKKTTPIIADHLKAAQKVQAQMKKDGLL